MLFSGSPISALRAVLEREAVKLTKAYHQAPFGKGGKTIVDTDMKNTWELSADQFELQNPAWQITLEHQQIYHR